MYHDSVNITYTHDGIMAFNNKPSEPIEQGQGKDNPLLWEQHMTSSQKVIK